MIEISDNPKHNGVKRKLEVFREIRIDSKGKYDCEVLVHHFEDDGLGGYGDILSGNKDKDPNNLFRTYKVLLPINNDILVNPSTGNVLEANYDNNNTLVDYTDTITLDTVAIGNEIGEYDYVSNISTNDLTGIDVNISSSTPVLFQVNVFRDYTIQKMANIGKLD